jgi:hypothetical protein
VAKDVIDKHAMHQTIQLHKCDSFLAAALATNFSGYEFSDLVELLIEVQSSCDVVAAYAHILSVCGKHSASVVSAHLEAESRYLSATGSLAWLEELSALECVSRLALANSLKPSRPLSKKLAKLAFNNEKIIPLLEANSEVVLGVIDHGCPFAHAELMFGQKPRIQAIWDQDKSPEMLPTYAFTPSQFGYGAVVASQAIQELAVFANKSGDMHAYEALGYTSLRHAQNHGINTLGLFAGARLTPSIEPRSFGLQVNLGRKVDAKKPAACSPIVFVQLPRINLLAPFSTSMGRSIVDGVRFVLSHVTATTKRVVVCIPYGSQLGPHDGSSVIEKALDEMVKHARKKKIDLKLVFASGNSANQSVYAQVEKTVSKKQHGVACEQLCWIAPPHLQAIAVMDIWLKIPTEDVSLILKNPEGVRTELWLKKGYLDQLFIASQAVGSIRVAIDSSNHQLNIQLQLNPEMAHHNSALLGGRWSFAFMSDDELSLDASIYVSWGGRNRGFGQRMYPTKLLALRPEVKIPSEGAILGTASGRQTYVAGGHKNAPNYVRAPYSCSGESRAAVKKQVTCHSLTEESPMFGGLACVGLRTAASYIRVNGTSVAAPMLARSLADFGWIPFGGTSDQVLPSLVDKPQDQITGPPLDTSPL